MASNRTRLMLKTIAATLFALLLLGAGGALIVLKSGWYNVASTSQHFQLVHTILEQGMHDSVQRHARAIAVPPLTKTMVERGAGIYRDNCARCHGAPGVAQDDFGKSMQPVPGPLVEAARRWQPRELYWITRHGIKMSGMPAWEFHLSENELWSVVAFMQSMPALSAPDYAALAALPPLPSEPRPAQVRLQGDPERGRIALTQYACNACHMIPGVTGSAVYVGRPLNNLAGRKFIAGHLPNTRENLIRWIRDPKSVDPQTAMPMQGVTETDALDISAYLLKH